MPVVTAADRIGMERGRRFRRLLARLFAATLGTAVLSAGGPATVPARADGSHEARLLQLTNATRAARGVGALSIDPSLTAVASRWAESMAAAASISHNPSLPGQLAGWRLVAENVGVGGSVEAVHQGFLNSPTHLVNIVDPAVTKVGFGIAWSGERVFVVENFMQPAASQGSITTPSIPPTTSSTTTSTTAPPTLRAAGTPSATAAGDPTMWLVMSFETLRRLELAG